MVAGTFSEQRNTFMMRLVTRKLTTLVYGPCYNMQITLFNFSSYSFFSVFLLTG